MPRVPAILALLGPALLVSAWIASAGRLAVAPPADFVRRIDESLAQADPRVVILGASKVASDLDLAAIADGLGIPRGEVVAIAQNGSALSLWYLLLAHRVYDAGHRPRLVVVYSTLDRVLATDVPESARGVLVSHMVGDEPALREKVFGGVSPTGIVARVRAHRGRVRRTAVDGIRDAAVGLIYGGGDVRKGQRISRVILARTFPPATADQVRVVPVVEAAPDRFVVRVDRVRHTLVPDLAALVEEHGGRLVIARAPVRADVEALSTCPPRLERELVERLNADGVGYLDLRGLPDDQFGDPTHTNTVGKRHLTQNLVEGIRALGGLGVGPMPAGEVPEQLAEITMTRVGPGPELPGFNPERSGAACGWRASVPGLEAVADATLLAAGLGPVSPVIVVQGAVALNAHSDRRDVTEHCAGASLHIGGQVLFSPTAGSTGPWTLALSPDLPLLSPASPPAHWVYPGTTVTFSSAEPAEAWSVAAMRFGDGVGVATVDGVPLTGVPFVSAQGRFAGGPWQLSVTSPPDGPWLYLQRVWVRSGARERAVVGVSSASAVGMTDARFRYAAEPPALPQPGTMRRDPDGAYDANALRVPGSDALSGWSSACPPLRVLEAGVPLVPGVEESGGRVKGGEPGPGGFLYAAGRLTIVPRDRTAPIEIALAPDRACRRRQWLYPGDTLTVSWAPEVLGRLGSDPVQVSIVGATFGGRGVLGVHMRSEGHDFGTATVSLEDLPGNVAVPASAPIPRAPGPIEVELRTAPDAPYVLIENVALQDAAGMPG